MVYKRQKNRTRVVELKKGQVFETFTGEKLPIMQAPMIFTDLYKEFLEKNDEFIALEKQRKDALIKGEDFDHEAYTKVAEDYLQLAYDIIETVISFQGYEVDLEWIKNNFTQEDVWFYMLSVNLKTPVYSAEDVIETKKK